MSLKAFIEKVFPLPSVEKRSDGVFKHVSFKKENDVDYLCDKAALLLWGLTLALLAIILIDVKEKMGMIIDPSIFQKNKLVLPHIFTSLTRWPTFFFAFIIYLRLRLTINIKDTQVLIFVDDGILLKYTRAQWIRNALTLIALFPVCVFWSYNFVIMLAGHFEKQDSLLFIAFLMLFQSGGPVTGFYFFIPGLLLLEKVLRFYPEFQQDIRKIAKTAHE